MSGDSNPSQEVSSHSKVEQTIQTKSNDSQVEQKSQEKNSEKDSKVEQTIQTKSNENQPERRTQENHSEKETSFGIFRTPFFHLKTWIVSFIFASLIAIIFAMRKSISAEDFTKGFTQPLVLFFWSIIPIMTIFFRMVFYII